MIRKPIVFILFFMSIMLLAGCQRTERDVAVEIYPDGKRPAGYNVLIRGGEYGDRFPIVREMIEGVLYEGMKVEWEKGHAQVMISGQNQEGKIPIVVESTVRVKLTFKFRENEAASLAEVGKMISPGKSRVFASPAGFSVD